MLSPDYINNLPEGIVKYWQDVEDFIIKDIARRFQKMDGVTGTAEMQRLALQNLGADLTDIDKRIAAAVGKTQEDITQLFEEAAAKVQQDYDGWAERAGRTVDKGVINQITRAAIETAKGDFDNITGTMGYVTNNGQLSLWSQAYRQQLSFATMQVASGATSYTEAARQIIKTFASDGIIIQYPSGVRRSLETAVRLNISSGVAFMANSIAQENAEQLGADGWEISVHMASAPDHEPYQGRQYTNAEYEALNNMLDRPIGTLNCRHIGYPIILGISERAYTDAELDAMKRKNAEGIDYEGKHYTMYEATQMQRKLERAIRSCKRELIGADAAKDSELFTNKSIRLNVLRRKYEDFSNTAGLLTQNERAQVARYGRSISARSVNANKEAFYKEAKMFYNNNVENEPRITELIKEFGARHGFEIAGLDFRVKSEKSYMRKALDEWNAKGTVTGIKDILRYTYIAKPEDLARKTNEALTSFKKAGNEVIKVKNTWTNDNSAYKGINTNIRAKDGIVFEVQYHTKESFNLKNGKLHELYEKQRILPVQSEEYKRLDDEMLNLSKKLKKPDNISEVKDV